ncbi:hypothetical protein ACJMK2_038125 [Sinanodonta woodiana]|uniref:Uncharacterized protein n=1 Tax=Sinanodonta woodiana TaxID=1069815 RepID=A0ABD3WR00_SINWO
MVWLKDVTDSLQTNKRKLNDANLPNNLAFQLRVGSRTLSLNLKRNHAIDPNANVYFVSEVNDGRPLLEKAHILKEEDVAYYQDKQNGAFMTVKCLRRLNGGCDRVINGNILIEDRNYDLHPAKSDITSRDLFDVPDLGTRYVLRPQRDNQGESMAAHEDTTTFKAKVVEERIRQRFSNGKEHNFFSDFTSVSRKKFSSPGKGNRKQVYYVEIYIYIYIYI